MSSNFPTLNMAKKEANHIHTCNNPKKSKHMPIELQINKKVYPRTFSNKNLISLFSVSILRTHCFLWFYNSSCPIVDIEAIP